MIRAAAMYLIGLLLLLGGNACSRQPGSAELVSAFDPPNAVLVAAVCRGDVDAIDEAIRAGANIYAVGRGGHTPIYAALECNRARSVTALLDHGLDPNVRLPAIREKRWDVGYTPLFIAVAISDERVVRALLEGGADPNAIKAPTLIDSGSTVLEMAITRDRWRSFNALLEHGADLGRPIAPATGHNDAYELLASRRDYCVLLNFTNQMQPIQLASLLDPIEFNDRFPDESAADSRCKARLAPIALTRSSVGDLIAHMEMDAPVFTPEEIAHNPANYTDEAIAERRRRRAVEIRTTLERRYLPRSTSP